MSPRLSATTSNASIKKAGFINMQIYFGPPARASSDNITSPAFDICDRSARRFLIFISRYSGAASASLRGSSSFFH